MNLSLKNYSYELFNLTRTVGKVALISTFTIAVCESWNVSDKYTWDNAGDHKQLSMYQTLCKAAITWYDLSPHFFCIDAMLLCEFESDKINEFE